MEEIQPVAVRQVRRIADHVRALTFALGEGILNSDDVERHPLRNVITKAVGARDSIDLEVQKETLQPGELVLLCSDGLHGMVNDQEIARLILSGQGSLEDLSQSLVDAANEAGGRDNVTVVLLRYSEGT